MGGSFKLSNTHSFETCTTFTSTQVQECVEAGIGSIFGELIGKEVNGASLGTSAPDLDSVP